MAKNKLSARDMYEADILKKQINKSKKKPKKRKKDKQKLKLDILNASSDSKSLALSLSDLKDIMPVGYKGVISNKTLTEINHLIQNADVPEELHENIITFSHVMESGTWSVTQYINAVRYCTFISMEYSKEDAYKSVFPDKWKTIRKKNDLQRKGIVNAYNRSKLVQKITAQILVPQHFFYQDVFHKAVMKQALLLNSHNEVISQRAADSLMSHLTPPQEAGITLDISTKSAQLMTSMLDKLVDISDKQRNLTKAKIISPEDALNMKFIEGESNVKKQK